MVGRRLISGKQALGVEIDMRNALYAQLLRLSFGFYDRHQTGQLMSRATVDLQARPLLPRLRPDLLLPARAHDRRRRPSSCFVVDWELALIALAITPLLVVLAYRYSHVSHPLLRDVQQKLADVATVAEENIVGVHVVKAFAQEPAEQAKFARALRGGLPRRASQANRQRALYVPLLSFLPLLAQAAVLLVGGRMVANGDARRSASFVAFNLYLADARHAAAHRSACGSARRSARPRPASGSSR